MNKDRVEGKVKDITGRTERQVGEWTGDAESQVKGAAKQVEGKVQNGRGKVKDAVSESVDDLDTNDLEDRDELIEQSVEEDESTPRRRAS